MNRLLYLSNGPRKRSVAALEERFERCGLALDQYWAFDGEFPDTLDGYCGVFLSGSPHGAYEDIPFIHREHELINEVAVRGLPMLGICFGSQILASALCGRDQVFRRATCEVGYKNLAMSKEAARDPLAQSAGRELRMFVWHNDEVRADHPDMRILAASDECPNQIWRYRDQPVWGIQGHPEIDRAQALAWFELSRARFEADGADIAALAEAADDTAEAKTLLHAFAAFCRTHQATSVEE
jgi:GMP synthase (glutamine-hydrolysing)